MEQMFRGDLTIDMRGPGENARSAHNGSRAGIDGEGVTTSGGTPAYSYVEVARFQQP
jgi:hypothetical protein